MKLYKGLICSLVAGALMTGCSKEDPFFGRQYDGPTGTLITHCLAPTLTNPEGLEIATRAAVPSTDDFNVVIVPQDGLRDSSQPYEYKYSDMPEVITLPTGEYKVYAHYGDNKTSAWDEPYYYGETSFQIKQDEITDDVDPIVAKLSNIRVTIVYHPSLLSAISNDSKVEVKMGDQASMEFAVGESRSAYFKFVDNSHTLTATFSGTVDGSPVIVQKLYDNVAPGNHYRITFRMHGMEDDNPGTVAGSITVDASIEKVDMNHTIDGEEQELLEDDWRPVQGSGDTPGPGPDDPVKVKPYAVVIDPDDETDPAYNSDYKGFTPINLDIVNEVTSDLYCGWRVFAGSEGGFVEFNVEIISETLTAEELEGVGLAKVINLISPGEYEEALSGLGFPVNLGGKKEATFNITGFLSLLSALGESNHEFKLKIKNSDGMKDEISLKLHTK